MTNCSGDADLTIVETAMQIAKDGSHATAVADDTDVLVMLLNKWWPESLRHEARKNLKKNLELIIVKGTVSLLPSHVVDNLLCIHAWSGCDTTFAIYSHGKTKLLKVVERSPEAIAEICSTFKHLLSSQEKVASAGIQQFLRLYGKH